MKKYLLLLTMILLVGLVGCTPKTDLENENDNESKALELNKTTLAELLRENQIDDFSAEFNEETEKWIINHEYGTYEIANIK